MKNNLKNSLQNGSRNSVKNGGGTINSRNSRNLRNAIQVEEQMIVSVRFNNKKERIEVKQSMKIIEFLNILNEKFNVKPENQSIMKYPQTMLNTQNAYLPISMLSDSL